ncbi:hypothetical protein Tco_0538416 [Tanacetum coccineum]
MHTACGDGIASIKRCRRNLSSDGVRKMMTASRRNRLQSDLEDSICPMTTASYAEIFGADVPTTQSQPIESTQGMHRTTSSPRRSTRLTPPTPIPTTAEVEEMIVQDTIQLSIAEQKSHDDLEAKQNVEKVKEHLVAEEIEKMVEVTKNVEKDEVVNFVVNNLNDPDTRLDLESYKESPKVEITIVVQLVNIIEEEDKSVEDDYVLRRRVKKKNVEESRNIPSPTPIRSPRIHSTLISLDTEKLQELMVTDPTPSSSIPSSFSSKLYASQRLLSLFKPKTGHFKQYKSFFDEMQG